jgi:hypothetical protein
VNTNTQNEHKTEAVLFAFLCSTNRRLPQKLQFTYSNSEIEIVKEFNYFGILLTKMGNL